MEILVNVIGQKLKIATNLKCFISGSQQFVKFIFNMDDSWDNLTTFAQFRQNDVAYNQYLDTNNSVYLPREIGAGACTLILYGTGGNVRATTNYLTLTIDENILVTNAQSTEITQSLYEQLVNSVTTTTNRLQDRVSNVENVIQGLAGGAPIVVSSVSEMTDTEQIYILSTDGMWYYHNGSAWVAGGEYGAVATDTTLTQSRVPADAKTAGDAIGNLTYLHENANSQVLSYVQGRYVTPRGAIGNADGAVKTVSSSTALKYDEIDCEIFVKSGWKIAFPSFTDGLMTSATKTFISGPSLVSLDDIKDNALATGDSFAIMVRKDPEAVLSSSDFAQDDAFIFVDVKNTLNGIISETDPVLSDYKQTGFYYVTENSIQSIASEFPFGYTMNGGILEVYNGSFGVFQRYTDISPFFRKWERMNTGDWKYICNRFTLSGHGNINLNDFNFNAEMLPGIWSIPANSTAITPMPEGYDVTTRHILISFFAGAGFSTYILCGIDGTWIKNSNLTTWRSLYRTHRYKKITWVAVGDSITDGRYSYYDNGTAKTRTDHSAQYNYIASQILNMNPVIEYGYGGMGWLHVANDGTYLTDVLDMDFGNPDLITVCLGVNDRGAGSLGDANSTANDGTISGAIRNCCITLATKYPNAQIVFFTPLNSNSSGSIDTKWSRQGASRNNLDDIADLIKYWCDFYGFKVIDFLSESPINSINIVPLFPDRLHPSLEAHSMIGHYLAGVLPIRN